MKKLLTMFREASFSLFSDGKLSIKRILSWCFGMMVLWMAGRVSIMTIPVENQEVFKHCFDGLLLAIATLLGAATWKDASIAKSQKPTQETKVDGD
jgi:hypothetical protein